MATSIQNKNVLVTGANRGIGKAIVETLDLFPTLAALAKLSKPEFAEGQSLIPIIASPDKATGHAAISYTKRARTIRTSTHRLISHDDGHLELYDHRTVDGETQNVAQDQPKLAQDLLEALNDRHGRRHSK